MPRRDIRHCSDLSTVDILLQCPQPTDQCEHRVERLADRLPEKLRTTVRWLRRPSARWVRIPVGLLFVGASLLSILPLFGVWMLPLGLMLLAEDAPLLRRARDRLLEWIERHRPNWFTTNKHASGE
jgi:hypothetical protein